MHSLFKHRSLAAINRAMLYCLKTLNDAPCVALLGSDKVVPINEVYDTVMYLRNMLPNKEEARKLKELVLSERAVCAFHSKMLGVSEEYARRLAKLEPLLEKLEVLCGQT